MLRSFPANLHLNMFTPSVMNFLDDLIWVILDSHIVIQVQHVQACTQFSYAALTFGLATRYCGAATASAYAQGDMA
jgi:hypothetical protein